MDRPRAQTVNLSEITAVGSENSMAIMEMVKEGEMTLDEAIASVKNMTSKAKESGLNRRGGMKKFRGRLDLEVRFQKASAFSVLILDLKKGRDLMQVTSSQNTNPVVKVYISGGDKKQAKSKETDTHKGVVHPSFNDQFTWEFKTDQRKGGMRLHVVVENKEKGLLRQKKKVIGAMSFSIDSIWKADSPISGWFRLLDETRGANMNVPYKHHKPIIAPVVSPTNSAGVAAAAASATHGRHATLAATSDRQHRPLPAPPPGGDGSTNRQHMPLPPPPGGAGADAPPPVQLYRPATMSTPTSTQSAPDASNPFATPAPAAAGQDLGNPFLDGADAEPSNPFGGASQSSARRSATVSGTTRPLTKKRSTEKVVVKKISVDSFQYLKVLGQGSFGKVMLAEHKDTKDMVAIKVIKKEPVIEDDDVEATMTERRVLALSAGNPFLTGLHATFQTGDKLFYVMELISGGDLMFHIQNDKVFEIPRARFYAAEICLGLWYLHDHKVLYRDLKLDNVMLSATGHVKIADFGMCKENIPKGGRTSTFCGTPGYLAPEIIQEKPYGASVDWWALGVLLYEMMMGDSPFEADDDDELFHIICHSKPDVRSLPQTARDVVNGFLTKSPSKRLACDARGSDGVKSHPFFASIDWDKLLRQEIPPPFKPKTGKSVTDACNFDEEFTNEDPNVSPTDKAVARRLDQNVFRGFSFTTKVMREKLTKRIPVSDGDDHEANPFATGESADTVERGSDDTLTGQPWFHAACSRQQILQMLGGKKPLGSFCVRNSSTQDGCYVLSIAVGTPVPWTGLIASTPQGLCVHPNQTFDTLLKLVQHYTDHPVTRTIKGAPVTLRM